MKTLKLKVEEAIDMFWKNAELQKAIYDYGEWNNTELDKTAERIKNKVLSHISEQDEPDTPNHE